MNRKCVLAMLFMFGSSALAFGQTAEVSNNSSGYMVRAGDVLRIKVWPDSDPPLSGDFTVEETGIVHLPLIGPTRVGGVTIETVRASLRSRYTESAIKNAIVTITPIFKVSILGAVRAPGLYAVDPSQTVIDAVSLAGGFAYVDRKNTLHMERGSVSMRAEVRGELASAAQLLNTRLQSGDRIIVSASNKLTASSFLPAVQTIAVLVTLIIQLTN